MCEECVREVGGRDPDRLENSVLCKKKVGSHFYKEICFSNKKSKGLTNITCEKKSVINRKIDDFVGNLKEITNAIPRRSVSELPLPLSEWLAT